MRARLTMVRSGHASVKDSIVVGRCDTVPMIGYGFYMSAPPRNKNGLGRMIATAPVVKVISEGDAVLFETRNGHYALEILDESDV